MKLMKSVAAFLSVLVAMISFAASAKAESICYQVCVQGAWQNSVCNGAMAGTTGQGLAIQAIKVWFSSGAKLNYRGHFSNVGWRESHSGTGITDYGLGTCGSSRLEAIEAFAPDLTYGSSLGYWGHVQNIGDMLWRFDGVMQGTTGQGLQLEAIKMKIAGRNACPEATWYTSQGPWLALTLTKTGEDAMGRPICNGSGSYFLGVDGASTSFTVVPSPIFNTASATQSMLLTATLSTGDKLLLSFDRHNNLNDSKMKPVGSTSYTIVFGSMSAHMDWNLL